MSPNSPMMSKLVEMKATLDYYQRVIKRVSAERDRLQVENKLLAENVAAQKEFITAEQRFVADSMEAVLTRLDRLEESL